MNHAMNQGSHALLVLGLVGLLDINSSLSRAADEPQSDRTDTKAAPPAQPVGPWRAFGRVTDAQKRPVAGVEVWAYCGVGTLHRTGSATSGNDGRYVLNFGPGGLFMGSGGTAMQAATISAHQPGFFEENLNRQGGCQAAEAVPDENQMKRWGSRKDRLFLPDRPLELNFVMRPSGRVAGRLVDEQGKPLAGYSVGLGGPDNPPSMGAVNPAVADLRGRFVLEDIPTTFRFQFGVRVADPKWPWDDSWASAALRFERPDKEDMRAWFGDREIRIQEFVLRVAGPGMHGRTAMPIAGNAGVLNLTTDTPSDVQKISDKLLTAKSAVLTLRNATRQDLSRSLVTDRSRRYRLSSQRLDWPALGRMRPASSR
jgi:hypothetical protein